MARGWPALRRVRALIAKEFAQIRRDRRLAISLVLPPVLQLTLFGFALSPTVSNLRLGIVDESKTRESRELVATLTESRSFRVGGYYSSAEQLGTALSKARLDAGLVIPYHYGRDLRRGRRDRELQPAAQTRRGSGQHRASQRAFYTPSRPGAPDARVPLQPRTRRFLVHRDGRLRAAADPEQLAGLVGGHGQGARGGNDRAAAHV